MKIRDYFDMMKNKKLTDDAKKSIYQRISSYQKNSSSQSFTGSTRSLQGLFARIRTRKIAFSPAAAAVFACICVLSFSAFWAPQSVWRGIQTLGITDTVQAQKVGAVLYVQGRYQRQSSQDENISNRVDTPDNISDGDVLRLSEGSSMRLQIQDSHYAQVQGPATLKIYRVPNTFSTREEYRVVFLEGSVLSIESGDMSNDPLMSEEKLAKVSVETSDGTIIKTENTAKQRVLIKQSSSSQVIANDGEDDVQVQSRKSSKSITLPHKQAILIDNQKQQTVAVDLPQKDQQNINDQVDPIDQADQTRQSELQVSKNSKSPTDNTERDQNNISQTTDSADSNNELASLSEEFGEGQSNQSQSTSVDSQSSDSLKNTSDSFSEEIDQEDLSLDELMVASIRDLKNELDSIERTAQYQMQQQENTSQITQATGKTGTMGTGNVFTGNVFTGTVLTGNIFTGTTLTGTIMTGAIQTGSGLQSGSSIYATGQILSGIQLTGSLYQTGVYIHTGNLDSNSGAMGGTGSMMTGSVFSGESIKQTSYTSSNTAETSLSEEQAQSKVQEIMNNVIQAIQDDEQ